MKLGLSKVLGNGIIKLFQKENIKVLGLIKKNGG